jgi:hypothetical protein
MCEEHGILGPSRQRLRLRLSEVAVCQWLDGEGRDQLWGFYRAWRDAWGAGRDGVAAFTRVTGRAPTAPEVDEEWRAWVRRTQ